MPQVNERGKQIPDWLDGCGEGWHELCLRLHEELVEADPDYEVAQLKEKFGALRIYLIEYTEETMGLIQLASNESMTICEVCGYPGTCGLASQFWIKTLCDEDRARWRSGWRPWRGVEQSDE